MDLDVNALLDQTITVFTKLDAKTAKAREDAYFPCKLSPASWSQSFTRNVDSDGVTHLSRFVRVQVPASTADFLPYKEWAALAVSNSLDGEYSLSVGDYAILGETTVTGALSKSEMLLETSKYPRCEISLVQDCRNNGAVTSSDSGAGKYLSVIYAEGK